MQLFYRRIRWRVVDPVLEEFRSFLWKPLIAFFGAEEVVGNVCGVEPCEYLFPRWPRCQNHLAGVLIAANPHLFGIEFEFVGDSDGLALSVIEDRSRLFHCHLRIGLSLSIITQHNSHPNPAFAMKPQRLGHLRIRMGNPIVIIRLKATTEILTLRVRMTRGEGSGCGRNTGILRWLRMTSGGAGKL